MIKKIVFLIGVSILTVGTVEAALPSNYWAVTPPTPPSGQSYPVGTTVAFTHPLKVKLIGDTCTISASSSLTSSPWAATPASNSIKWGFQESKDVVVNVTVGAGTSTIKLELTCSQSYYSGFVEFTVTGLTPTNQVKITGMPITFSGNFLSMGGTTNPTVSSSDYNGCVYTSATSGNYYARIEGANDAGGKFYLAKDAINKFPVTLTWNNTALTPGQDTLFSGGSSNESCNGSTNATLVLSASSDDILKVPGSTNQYNDNFVITITHPDEI